MKQNPKSATVAGLLGIFLGGVGAHDFYLGGRTNRIKGIVHASLAGVAFLTLLIAGVILPNTMSLWTLLTAAGTLQVFCILAWVLATGNGIWALVEAIIILAKGDAGLAEQGIPTLTVAIAEPAKGGKGGTKTTAKTATATQVVEVKPRQPMDPAKKKKLIIGLSVGGGALVLLIVAIVLVVALSKVDYGVTYTAAKELNEKLDEFYYDSACEDAQYYADSYYTDDSEYADYVDECKSGAAELDELVAALGDTSAIKRDDDLKSAYDKFVTEYRKVLPEQATLEAGLNAMTAIHSFGYNMSELDDTSTEADIQEVCNYLINSGNETLVSIGQEAQPLITNYINAYKAWMDSEGYYNDEYDAYQDAQEALENFVDENDATVEEVVGFNLEDMNDVYSAYSDLYDDIVSKYEQNYDGKGNCAEYSGVVSCD